MEVTIDLDTGSGYIPLIASVSGMFSRNVSNTFLNSSLVPLKFWMLAGNILNIPPQGGLSHISNCSTMFRFDAWYSNHFAPSNIISPMKIALQD